MKVCVIQAGYPAGSEWLTLDPYRRVAKDWIPGAQVVDHDYIYAGDDTREQIRKIIARGYDLFINLCDAPINDPLKFGSVEIVEELKKANVAFTGADEHFWDVTRDEQKRLCREAGVPTAPYVFAWKEEDIKAAESLTFPLIVKHYNGPGGSEGISSKSRVTNAQELHDQSMFIINKYGGALIEEFIDGEEYTVLVSENPDDPLNPTVYPPLRIDFAAGGDSFKTFEIKWLEFGKMKQSSCEDKDVLDKLVFYSRKAFIAQNANSYGRIDWRVDRKGNVFYLEMNSQPSIFGAHEGSEPGSSDYILMQHPGGPKDFVHRIVNSALRAKALRDKAKKEKGKSSVVHSDGAPEDVDKARKRTRSQLESDS